jgi:ADP-dependent NAD(P)H-hydrate dehydratase
MTGGPALPRLPERDPAGHKGTFGTVVVIGGCAAPDTRMIGAPALTATAALRAGAGLARLVMPAPVLDAGLTIAPWATGVAMPVGNDGLIIAHEGAAVVDRVLAGGPCACLAIGPGLGRGDGARALTLRAIQQEDSPVVVDADALSALAQMPQVTRDLHAAAVLTPHPGEFVRLVRGMGLKNDLGLAESRQGAAEQLAQRLGCVVVLKGAGTVVSDGQRTWTNPTGHACLAVGGTGDVLTGVIAGIIAQFVALPAPPPPLRLPAGVAGKMRPAPPPGRPLDLFDAARLGVYVHGLAGERWSASHGASAGLLATELAAEIPAAMETLRAPGL